MDIKLEIFEIFNELKNELEKAPSLEEFFILIIQNLNAVEESSIVASFNLEFEDRIKIIFKESIENHKRLYDLNDNVHVLINGLLNFLYNDLKTKYKGKKLIDNILKSIVKIIQQSSDIHFDNSASADSNLLAVKANLNNKEGKKKRLKSGDVIAVPMPESKNFAIVVFITKNSFGLAYGIIDKVFESLPKNMSLPVDVIKYPQYSDDNLVQQGRWLVLFNDKELLNLFPESPELFHSPLHDSSNEPFGIAETVEGELRNLDAQEAKLLNIMSEDFVQTYTAKQLEYYIKKKLMS